MPIALQRAHLPFQQSLLVTLLSLGNWSALSFLMPRRDHGCSYGPGR